MEIFHQPFVVFINLLVNTQFMGGGDVQKTGNLF